MRTLKILIKKLEMPNKRQSLPPALTTAIKTAKVAILTPTVVIRIINTRNSPKFNTWVITTIANTKPKKKAYMSQKVKVLP